MELEDFYTKTLNEKASKMPLLMDEKDTGCYLMVTGIQAKSVAMVKLDTQIAYAEMSEKSEDIKDKLKKSIFERDKTEEIQNVFAAELINGWSFDEKCDDKAKRKLLEENQGLCSSVIAHAATSSEYFAKKPKAS